MADETVDPRLVAALFPELIPEDVRTKRQIRNQALAGRELTPEQEAYMAARLHEKEAASENMGAAGRELTGIPSIGRGYESVAKAIQEPTPGNIGRGVRDAGIAAVGAVPISRLAGKAVSGVVDALSGARSVIPTVAAGGGLAGAADAANAADFSTLVEKGRAGSKELFDALMGEDKYAPMSMEAFRSQRLPPMKSDADIVREATASAMASDAYKEMDRTNPRASTWARGQLVEKSVAQAVAAAKADRATREKLEARIPEEYEAYVNSLAKNKAQEMAKPFVDRHPIASRTMAGAAVAVPMAMGYSAVRGLGKEGAELLSALQKARAVGDTLGEVTAIRALQELQAGAGKHLGVKIAEGAAIPAGFRFAPDALDTMFVGPSPDKSIPSASDKVWEKWSSPGHMAHYGMSLIPAALEGASETIFGMGLGGRGIRPTYGRINAESGTLPKPPNGESWGTDRIAQELAKARTGTAQQDLSLAQTLLQSRQAQRLLQLQSEGKASAYTRNMPLGGTPGASQAAPPMSQAQGVQPGGSGQPPPLPQGPQPPGASAPSSALTESLLRPANQFGRPKGMPSHLVPDDRVPSGARIKKGEEGAGQFAPRPPTKD